MAIKCEQCGAALTDEDSKFCKYCGAKLPEEVKEDKKRREFRFEFNSEGSTRRAEIKKEREAQKLEHQREMMRQQQQEAEKQRAASEKEGKRDLIFAVVVIAFFLIMYLLVKK